MYGVYEPIEEPTSLLGYCKLVNSLAVFGPMLLLGKFSIIKQMEFVKILIHYTLIINCSQMNKMIIV